MENVLFHFPIDVIPTSIVILLITCSAVILNADWLIGVRPGAVHTL